MKITILDAYAANPGDLSWAELESLGEVQIYDRTAPEDVLKRAEASDIVLTNKVVLDANVMSRLPRLKYVGVLATGYNVVDTTYAHEHGIVVTNIPAYSTDSVVQMVFAHLLNVTNQGAHYAEACSKGRWASSPDFCFMDGTLHELAGKTMGIVGLGNIGSRVALVAHAFGMKVVAETSKEASALPEYINKVSREELFRTADVVSLHCPLTESTRGMVSRKTIAQMKPSAIIINTGRGPLVDDADVAEALTDGSIAAYCADVLTTEPPSPSNPLLGAPHAYLTPHIAWATQEARARLVSIAVSNVRAFCEGNPVNKV